MRFRIENMTCGGCARGVTKAVQSVDAAAAVEADVPARTITVHTGATPDAIAAALADAGFPAVPAQEARVEA